MQRQRELTSVLCVGANELYQPTIYRWRGITTLLGMGRIYLNHTSTEVSVSTSLRTLQNSQKCVSYSETLPEDAWFCDATEGEAKNDSRLIVRRVFREGSKPHATKGSYALKCLMRLFIIFSRKYYNIYQYNIIKNQLDIRKNATFPFRFSTNWSWNSLHFIHE